MAKSKHVPYHAEAYALPWGFNGKLAGPYRWFSGRPMNGHRYTDATGFRYGTVALDPSGHAAAYKFLPGYKRFLYARLPLMLAPGAAVCAVTAPRETALLAGGMATLAAKEVDKAVRLRRFRRSLIWPLSEALSNVLRTSNVARKGHTWVHVPPDFRDDEDAKIKIMLPVGWVADDGDKTRLVRVVSERLGVDGLTASWTLGGDRPMVELSVPPKPPAKAEFVACTVLAEDMDEDSLMVGLGAGGVPAVFSLAMESPHMLVAGGSGAGKSEFLAWLVGQLMRRGYGVAVLDAKFTSHMWLRKVPGVLYASESEELHDALIWLDQEMLRRARFVASGGDPAELEPLVILAEEMNGASNRLRGYWSSIKVTGQPAMSPALTAMANLSSMGRELRVHLLMAGQSLTAKAVGGPENRENFGGRALAKASGNQWKMLAPQIKPAPLKQGPPGRWHLVVQDRLTEFQVPFSDLKEKKTKGAEARLIAWATGGVPGWDVPAAMLEYDRGVGVLQMDDIPRSEPVPPPGISLRQYADDAGLELSTLTRWRERRSDFPVEVAIGANRTKLYDRDHLRDYVRARLREPVTAAED